MAAVLKELVLILALSCSLCLGCKTGEWRDKMTALIESAAETANVVDELRKALRVKEALISVDRDCFIGTAESRGKQDPQDRSYFDTPIPIGNDKLNNRPAISTPHFHVYAVVQLGDYLKDGSCVLDVGSGSGYLEPVFSQLVGSTGNVVAIDVERTLIDRSSKNIADSYPESRGNIDLRTQNVLEFDHQNTGCKEGFDAIHIGVSCDSKEVERLKGLMKAKSRMIIPVEDADGSRTRLHIITMGTQEGSIQQVINDEIDDRFQHFERLNKRPHSKGKTECKGLQFSKQTKSIMIMCWFLAFVGSVFVLYRNLCCFRATGMRSASIDKKSLRKHLLRNPNHIPLSIGRV